MIYRIVASLCLVFVFLSPAFVKDARALTMTYTEWKPFVFNDKNGQPRGFLVDIIRALIEDRLGKKLWFRELPWKRVQDAVARGDADFFAAIPTDARREIYLTGREALFAMKAPVYTLRDHPRLEAIRNIKSAKDIVALDLVSLAVLGNAWHETYIEGAGVDTMTAVQSDKLFRLLEAGRGDIIVDFVLDRKSSPPPVFPSANIVDTGIVLSHVTSNLLFSRKTNHNVDMDQLDAAIKDLYASGDIQDIFKRYNIGVTKQ